MSEEKGGLPINQVQQNNNPSILKENDIKDKKEINEIEEIEKEELLEKKEEKISKTSQEDKYQKVLVKKQKAKQESLLPILKLIAPGTPLRAAVEDVVKSKNGALIVVDDAGLGKIIEGGFRVNCRFTPQRLVELSKMDGAIILSKDMERILSSNTLLVPDIKIPTRETGTRHKAAERTAKQINTLVIAISERRKTITLYYHGAKYTVKNTAELLRRATESLQILEKQCEIFDDLSLNFNAREFTNLVTLNDVCLTIQRIEIILKIASIIKRYLIELGTESSIIKMRVRELIKDIEKEEFLVISDFSKLKTKKTKSLLSVLSFEELLEIENIIIALGYSPNENIINSKGYRILDKIGLMENSIKSLVKELQNFKNISEASTSKLADIFKNKKKAKSLQQKIIDMKEQVMLGRKI